MYALPAARVSIFYCQGMVPVGARSVFLFFKSQKWNGVSIVSLLGFPQFCLQNSKSDLLIIHNFQKCLKYKGSCSFLELSISR